MVLVPLLAVVLSQAPTKLEAPTRPMKGLSDGKGHVFLYDAQRPYDALFYGDGKVLHQVPTVGGGMNGDETWNVYFWDPRFGFQRPDLSMADEGKRFTLSCGKRSQELKPLPEDEVKATLASASFLGRKWLRMPEKLLRDDAGTYYFVDRLRADERRDFRLFKGQRGAMKLMPLKDIVDDSQGMVFSTRDGQLRLVVGSAPKWVAGKKEAALVDVPVEDNVKLIYLELGPYLGATLGTPCDDL